MSHQDKIILASKDVVLAKLDTSSAEIAALLVDLWTALLGVQAPLLQGQKKNPYLLL